MKRKQIQFQDCLQLELNIRGASADMELLDTPAVNDLFQRANDAAARKSGLSIFKDTFALGTDMVTVISAAVVLLRFDAVMVVILVLLAVVSMLLNLCDEGAILLKGRDIREYDYRECRKMSSMAFQDYKYYVFSIAENVAVEYYDRDDVEQRKRIQEALRKSGLWEKVSALPLGMDTLLNRMFDENGVNLSGGEAQKLALARALYRGGEVLILDEPSSALDPKAEDELISRFREISGDRLVIYVPRKSFLIGCDLFLCFCF